MEKGHYIILDGTREEEDRRLKEQIGLRPILF